MCQPWEAEARDFSTTGRLQQMKVNGRIGSVRWDINRADSTLFYGVAMDGTQGVVVDNFSLRGSSGLSFAAYHPKCCKSLMPSGLMI